MKTRRKLSTNVMTVLSMIVALVLPLADGCSRPASQPLSTLSLAGAITSLSPSSLFTNGGSIPILTYHSVAVSTDPSTCFDYTRNTLLGLQTDLEVIYNQGFTIVPLSWVVEWRTGTRDASQMPDRPIVLTFDDGIDTDWIDSAIPAHPCAGQMQSVRTKLQNFQAAHADTLPAYSPHGTFFVIAGPNARMAIDSDFVAAGYGTPGINNYVHDTWWAAANSGMFDVQNHSVDHDHSSIRGAIFEPNVGTYIAVGGYADQPDSWAGNSGFETPYLGSPPWNYAYNPSGAAPWVFIGTSGISGNGSYMSLDASAVGYQVGFIQGPGTIYQDNVNFPFTNTGRYSFMFYAVQRPSNHDAEMQIQVSVDSTVIGTYNPNTPAQGWSIIYTPVFTVTPGPHRVTFTGVNPTGYDNTILFDNVQLPNPWDGGMNFTRINNLTSNRNEIALAANYIQTKIGNFPNVFAYPFGPHSSFTENQYLPNYINEHHAGAAVCGGGGYVTRTSPIWCLPRFVFGSNWANPADGATTTNPDLAPKVLAGAWQ